MITALDKKTALVLIDLQNSIVASKVAHPVDDILSNVNSLLTAFRKQGMPVFVINVNPAGTAWTKSRKEVNQPAAQGDEPFRITRKLHAEASDIRITKHTWNAFFETGLNDELRNRTVTGIVLAGISTSIGVEGTARAAGELGYNITFATDAMTDTQEAAHQRSVQYIFPRLGETGTTKEIIEMLVNIS